MLPKFSLPLFAELELPEFPLEDSFMGNLTEEQRDRVKRFARPLRRRQYVWSRLLLAALGEMLFSGTAVTIQETPPLSPRLLAGNSTLHTSVTHSGMRVACLISEEQGAVDIERIDSLRPLERCAETAFSRETAVAVLKEPDFVRAFYEAWGAHECAVKLGIPQSFRWEKGTPRIEGFDVEVRKEGDWMKVTATCPGKEIQKLETTGIQIVELLHNKDLKQNFYSV